MSIECSECERDARGPHDETCSRYSPVIDGQPVATMRTTENGNVVILFGGRMEVEFTPEQCTEFARQLLHRAMPKEHVFIIPVVDIPGVT